MTRPRTWENPHLELATRLGDPLNTMGLANELSAEEAELAIEAFDEADADEKAGRIGADLRKMGHVL